MSASKPLQVIPADGWTAVYAYRDDDGSIEFYEQPIVSWALSSRKYRGGEVGREVVGLVVAYERSGYIEPAYEDENAFVGYKHRGDDLSAWQAEAESAVSRQERVEADEKRLHAGEFEYRPDEYGGMWYDSQTHYLLERYQAARLLRERAA